MAVPVSKANYCQRPRERKHVSPHLNENTTREARKPAHPVELNQTARNHTQSSSTAQIFAHISGPRL